MSRMKELIFKLNLRYHRMLERCIYGPWFSFRLNLLAWRYGGAGNIPSEVLGKFMRATMDFDDLAKTTAITSALRDIALVCQKDALDFKFTTVIGLFSRGELEDLEEFNRILEIRESKTNVRRRVLEELFRWNDLNGAVLDHYLASPEDRARFYDWLDFKRNSPLNDEVIEK